MDRVSGFTLIELIIVLTIASILAAIVVPSMRTLMVSNQMTSQINRYVASMHLARSEAVKRGRRVAICKSADGDECTTSGGWEQGWMVFVDDNNNGSRETDETIAQVNQAMSGSATLRGNRWVRNYISYRPNGMVRLVSGGLQMGTLVICDERGFDQAKALILYHTGRLRVREVAASTVTSCLVT